MTAPAPPNKLSASLSFLPRFAAILVGAAAILVLAGWILDVEILKRLPPAQVAMNPATAGSFLLLAAALWLLRNEPSNLSSSVSKWIARGCAAAVVLIAAARPTQYFLGWNAGVDQLLFRARLGGNEMAPNTAATLLLVGLAFILLDVSFGARRFHPSTALIIAAAGIAFFSLTGYFYSAATLYGIRGYIPMALNTAIVFLVLCIGMLCARPDRQPVRIAASATLGGTVARRLIPPAFLVPLLLGGAWIYGRTKGLYSDATGLCLFILSIIIVFNVLTWWCAEILRKAELRQQRAEMELRQSEQRYRAIMEQSAEGIYLVDLETRRITECNSALERLLGFAPGQGNTKTVYDLVDDAPDHVDQRLKRLIDADGPLHGEREYRRADGTPIEVESSAAVISYAGRRVACTVVHDISARKRAERELQEKHRQLQQAMEQLKLTQSQLVQAEKLASLGQMVAGVAHEINNPLSFVSNNVAVLERDSAALLDLLKLYNESDPLLAEQRPELANAIRELVERIDMAYTIQNLRELTSSSREGLRRIQQIVKDLRDFARLDQAEVHEADLNAGIESTLNIIGGLAKKKRVTIDKQLREIPLITCQLAKINQVVMNLLANAIDACREGGKVTISTCASDNQVSVEVSDTGHGIPPAIQERIFDPFFTTKSPGAGTGLGLSISYGIIKDHGGKIEVDSEPGKGATFTVRLPVKSRNVSGDSVAQ